MHSIKIPCKPGEVSDGYHTFDELYEHRCTLFLALMKAHPSLAWISAKHHDGSAWDGWFVAGIKTPTGDVTYHLPQAMWTLACSTGAAILEFGLLWDGHTSPQVVERIQAWIALAERPSSPTRLTKIFNPTIMKNQTTISPDTADSRVSVQRLVRLLADFESHAKAFRDERADVMTEVGDGLRKLRLQTKVSLRQAALRLGCSAAFLSDLEKAKRNPTIEWVRKIETAMFKPNLQAEPPGSKPLATKTND